MLSTFTSIFKCSFYIRKKSAENYDTFTFNSILNLTSFKNQSYEGMIVLIYEGIFVLLLKKGYNPFLSGLIWTKELFCLHQLILS